MTPEQTQRIEQIQERQSYGGATPNDVDFLLSLVKSQEAELAEMQERIVLDRSIKNTMAQHAGDAGARVIRLERELESIATSMRSAGVEKVRALRDKWKGVGDRSCGYDECYNYALCDAADEIITTLESVSIQEQK